MGAVLTGVDEALDGAVGPVTDGTLVAGPAESETAHAMTAVLGAADFCGGGKPWALPPWGSCPERRKDWLERAAGCSTLLLA